MVLSRLDHAILPGVDDLGMKRVGRKQQRERCNHPCAQRPQVRSHHDRAANASRPNDIARSAPMRNGHDTYMAHWPGTLSMRPFMAPFFIVDVH